MSQSWRIKSSSKDLSASVSPNTSSFGATVIRASRGTDQPVLINKGEERRLLDMFGTPSSSYPNLFEALEYIKSHPCYISAPSLNGYQGGVFITTSGSEAMVSGLNDLDNLDFEAIPVRETVNTGDGTTTNFTLTIASTPTDYVNQSIDIEVDGVSASIVATDAEPEVLSGTNIDTGSQYTRATGALVLNFSTAPADGEVIVMTYDIDRSDDVYAVLVDRSPTANWLSTQIISEASDQFTISLYIKNSDGTYDEVKTSSYTVALTAGTKNGFGVNIGMEYVFEEDDYVRAKVNTALSFSSYADDTSKTDFAGGSRGDTITVTELTTGWNYFQKETLYPAKVFFDCTADAGIPALFNTLKNSYQKYSRYLLPLPNESDSNAITTKSGYSIDNDGLAFYWNYFKIQDTFNNSTAITNLMGRVAVKHADTLELGFGGYSPSWIDENGMGGQLGSGILEAVYNVSETALQALDEAQINPIIFDKTYGVMIVSDRSAKVSLSDYSYIPHVGLRDYLMENIINQVLPRQITKLNDDFHRTQVKNLARSIILTTDELLEDFEVKCDRENNDDNIRQQRKFVLQVAVKYITFAQTIEFEFINTSQGTSVSDVLV